MYAEGGGKLPRYREDFFQRIVGVHWREPLPSVSVNIEVIVVFMETSGWDPQPAYKLTPVAKRAQLLDTWFTPTWSKDPAPLKNTAFLVNGNGGVFLTSVAPKLPADPNTGAPQDINGTWLNVLVFAFEHNNNVVNSLSSVTIATKLIAPALYIANPLNADLPSEVAPSGLLWGAETGAMAAGVTMQWKMRYGIHRPITAASLLPNSMVQCYPISSSHAGYSGDEKITFEGYFLIAYRLDDAGVGHVFSESPKVTEIGTQNLPPEWSSVIARPPRGEPFTGIPFSDPPPLILQDVT
jgi:hypothetical protein